MAAVLIADDDRNTRLLVDAVLTHAGHRVLEAKDGLEAVRVAAAELPDLVMLDLSLPDMSGPEILRALRSNPRTKALKVALYTATALNSAIRDFMEMYGVCDVIPKPSEPAELLASVERALEGPA